MSPFDFREDPKSGLVNFSFLHVLEGARIPQLSCTICYSASKLLCVQFPRIQFLWESSAYHPIHLFILLLGFTIHATKWAIFLHGSCV
jgi:hypothetical protein